ncbi:hypothetical protein [Sphingomonas paucimobilis]|jgi:hypothetical protein|uniref:Uncharacterized protein n=2 Tax=Sphingomonas paucimobilis TaxID=13689 RepID=A0A7T3A8A5_SPHPI|nr:hypothetical protein [Sphingomonas paucimobilis]QPT07891.1 hypothetical protein I6G38_14015 [Sphingomonas paucimobilis]
MTMYQEFIPQGPNRTPSPTSKIDRTQILDPKDFWRDPMTCPDWPALTGNMRYDGARGKAGAEARLNAIGVHLNRGEGALRMPTPDEREKQFAATFRRTGAPWHAMGIVNLSPLGMMVENDAHLMAEACHIRGYLRKLEIVEAREADAAKERKLAEARQTLAEYRRDVPDEIEEYERLAEAAARHKQRIEDERAFDRSRAIRDHVATLHSAAVRAAHTLGLGVPDAPAIL